MAEDRKHNQYKLDRDAKELLTKRVLRIEKLAEEKKAIADDIADIYKTLKAEGFDSTVIRKLVAERKKKRDNPAKFEDQEDMLDLYRVAMGSV